VLRLFIGEQDTSQGINTETLVLLETNIDDLNPEIYAHVMDRLFSSGALDVYMTPIQMKKNRPGTQLSVLCVEQDSFKIQEILFLETSTLGIREVGLRRHSLKRELQKVATSWGAVSVKIAHLPNGEIKFAPEHEDCRKLAQQHGVALREIYNTVIKAIQTEEYFPVKKRAGKLP
jgi:uncharacterized protein (DUF111 family)